MVFRCLSEDAKTGRPPSAENAVLLEELNKFYEDYYKDLNYSDKIDASNLSYIIDELITDIVTNINNNIQLHFINRIKQFVNQSFKKSIDEQVDKAPKKEKTPKDQEKSVLL